MASATEVTLLDFPDPDAERERVQSALELASIECDAKGDPMIVNAPPPAVDKVLKQLYSHEPQVKAAEGVSEVGGYITLHYQPE